LGATGVAPGGLWVSTRRY